MSSPINALVSGTFSTGATLVPVTISLPTGFDNIEIINITDFADAGATTQVMRAKGYSFLGAGSAFYTQKTNGAATLGTETMVTTGGFTFISNAYGTALGAPIAITGISQANPAVLATASTPVSAGDIVRIYGTTSQHQIAGLDFTVGTVVANTSFQLAYLNSSAFANAATAGFWVKIPYDSAFYPKSRYITAITQAVQAVVTLSVTHGYVAGEKVRLSVPAAFGMTQMDGILATIVSVNTATNTITVDVNSAAFTAFAYPTTAVADAGISFPQVVPVGESAVVPYGNLYDDAKVNLNFAGVKIDTTVLIASKTYGWIARKGLTV